MTNEKINDYKEKIKFYHEQMEPLTKKYKACRELKRYLKSLDTAIEKKKKTNKVSRFLVSSSLKTLYETIFPTKKGEQQ